MNKVKRLYVREFHFVCRDRRGVKRLSAEHFITGLWAVSQRRCEEAARLGALVALHQSKASPSYVQGKIISWKVVLDPETQRDRIQFTVQKTSKSLRWGGNGSGEKGYVWSSE